MTLLRSSLVPRRLFPALLAPAFFLQISCATSGSAVNPSIPSPADPATLGRIGFVAGRGVPAYSFDQPELDGLAAVGATALAGVFDCMQIAGPGAAPAAALVCLPIWAMVAAVGAIASAPPATATDAAKRRVAEAVASLHLVEAVRRAGLDYARAVDFRLQAVDPGVGPAGPDAVSTYVTLAGALDSVLEISLQRLYPQTSFTSGVPVYFTVDAQVRVVAVPDGGLLDSFRVSRVTPTHATDEWLARDGELLRADLQKVAADIAVGAIESLMTYRPPVAAGAVKPRRERVPGFALRPVSPPIRITNPFLDLFRDSFKTMTCGEDYQGGVTYGWQERMPLASRQPEFRWEALPRDFDRQPGDGAGEIHDLRYDFRIFDKKGLVYERLGLVEAFHAPDNPLDSCAEFRWTVRARFTLNGVTRATEWTGAYDTIGGYMDPAWIRDRPGKASLAGIPEDQLQFFPIVQTPAADGGTCKCR
jgi:hypothetical protein